MTESRFLLLTLILTVSVQLTRSLPFLIMGQREHYPKSILYLGQVLPAAMMGLLVVLCFRSTDFSDLKNMLPMAAACAATAVLHLWKRNMILSIAAGTVIYMILIRII